MRYFLPCILKRSAAEQYKIAEPSNGFIKENVFPPSKIILKTKVFKSWVNKRWVIA